MNKIFFFFFFFFVDIIASCVFFGVVRFDLPFKQLIGVAFVEEMCAG